MSGQLQLHVGAQLSGAGNWPPQWRQRLDQSKQDVNSRRQQNRFPAVSTINAQSCDAAEVAKSKMLRRISNENEEKQTDLREHRNQLDEARQASVGLD